MTFAHQGYLNMQVEGAERITRFLLMKPAFNNSMVNVFTPEPRPTLITAEAMKDWLLAKHELPQLIVTSRPAEWSFSAYAAPVFVAAQDCQRFQQPPAISTLRKEKDCSTNGKVTPTFLHFDCGSVATSWAGRRDLYFAHNVMQHLVHQRLRAYGGQLQVFFLKKDFNSNLKTLHGALSAPSLSTPCTRCHHLLSAEKLGSFHWELKNVELR